MNPVVHLKSFDASISLEEDASRHIAFERPAEANLERMFFHRQKSYLLLISATNER